MTIESALHLSDAERSAIEASPNARGATRAVVTLAPDGQLDVAYHVPGRKFDRIRRITGYLVGTLDRFNDAKRAEERDRVKHGLTPPAEGPAP